MSMISRHLISAVTLLAMAAGVFEQTVLAQEKAGETKNPVNTLSDAEKAAGWKLLFDGKSTTGWKNYKKATVGDGWKVEDGTLVRKDKGAGDILTAEQFDRGPCRSCGPSVVQQRVVVGLLGA